MVDQSIETFLLVKLLNVVRSTCQTRLETAFPEPLLDGLSKGFIDVTQSSHPICLRGESGDVCGGFN